MAKSELVQVVTPILVDISCNAVVPFDYHTVKNAWAQCHEKPNLKKQNRIVSGQPDENLRLFISYIENGEYETGAYLLTIFMERLLGTIKFYNQNESTFCYANSAIDTLVDCFYLRSEALVQIGDINLAVNDMRHACLLKPNIINSYLRLGICETFRDRTGSAEVAYRFGLELAPYFNPLKARLEQIREQDGNLGQVHFDTPAAEGVIQSRRSALAEFERVDSYPPIIEAILYGEVEELRRLWLPEYRNFRYGHNESPLMFFTVYGRQAGMLGRNLDSVGMFNEDWKAVIPVIDFLVENGVRLDAPDLIGETAIMYAASGSRPQPEILEHLLKKGADPDVKNVFGSTALAIAIRENNYRIIEILLQYKADPRIKDNDNQSPHFLAKNDRFVQALFQRYLQTAPDVRSCATCSKVGSRRCKKCRIVFYCGLECQTRGWKDHKKYCKVLRADNMRLVILGEREAKMFEPCYCESCIDTMVVDGGPPSADDIALSEVCAELVRARSLSSADSAVSNSLSVESSSSTASIPSSRPASSASITLPEFEISPADSSERSSDAMGSSDVSKPPSRSSSESPDASELSAGTKSAAPEFAVNNPGLFASDAPGSRRKSAESSTPYEPLHSRQTCSEEAIGALFTIYDMTWPYKGNLLVKVVAGPRMGYTNDEEFYHGPDPDIPYKVSNEAGTFSCSLHPHFRDGYSLYQHILDYGVQGAHAYFYAYMDPGVGELVLMKEPKVPPQCW